MSDASTNLSLALAVGADNARDYLKTGLRAALVTLDALFNATTGHTHSGAGQGGPLAVTPAMMAATVWTTFTPTLTQGVGITITVTYAAYLLLGKLAVVQMRLACTSAGTASNLIGVGGIPAAIAPKRTDAVSAVAPAGVFQFLDASVGYYVGVANFSGATTLQLYTGAGAGSPLGIAPATTVANTDVLGLQLCYEVA